MADMSVGRQATWARLEPEFARFDGLQAGCRRPSRGLDLQASPWEKPEKSDAGRPLAVWRLESILRNLRVSAIAL